MDEDRTRTASFWRCATSTPRDRRNLTRTMIAMAIWAVCFIGASQLLKRDLVPGGALPWVLAALPALAGVLVLFAYARFLAETDELQRQIQLQALALGFGGTFFAIAAFEVLERAGAPHVEIDDLTFVMAGLYAIGSVLGWRRYR